MRLGGVFIRPNVGGGVVAVACAPSLALAVIVVLVVAVAPAVEGDVVVPHVGGEVPAAPSGSRGAAGVVPAVAGAGVVPPGLVVRAVVASVAPVVAGVAASLVVVRLLRRLLLLLLPGRLLLHHHRLLSVHRHMLLHRLHCHCLVLHVFQHLWASARKVVHCALGFCLFACGFFDQVFVLGVLFRLMLFQLSCCVHSVVRSSSHGGCRFGEPTLNLHFLVLPAVCVGECLFRVGQGVPLLILGLEEIRPDEDCDKYVEDVAWFERLLREGCIRHAVVHPILEEREAVVDVPRQPHSLAVLFDFRFVFYAVLVVEELHRVDEPFIGLVDDRRVVGGAVHSWHHGEEPHCERLVHVHVLLPVFHSEWPYISNCSVLGILPIGIVYRPLSWPRYRRRISLRRVPRPHYFRYHTEKPI